MRRNLIAGIALAVVTLAAPCRAEEAAAPVAEGAGAKAWTDLQAGGTAASQTARPLPGDIADKIYTRYADSFTHPIPEKMDRESFSSAGSGGSSGGASSK